MIKVGFTGTRHGMNPNQFKVLNYVLCGIYHHHFTEVEFHEGHCIGADEEASQLARNLGFKVIAHPPTDTSEMSKFPADVFLGSKPYLERDMDIAAISDLMIAAPNTIKETSRSGTWTTVRYARKMKKPIIYVLPG